MNQAPANPNRTGQLIAGKYRVERKLGEGAFGEVWLARQPDIGRTVVLKVLHTQWAQVSSIVERFRREAVATNRVQHPNICRVYDYAMTDDGAPYIAMEFLDGGTIKQEMRNVGRLPFQRVAQLMAPVCDGVAAAHAAGIIHRDLKLENVMITRRDGKNEEAVILDFGIAKLLDAAEKLTQTGSMMGTPTYMSPEQCKGSRDIGPAADVYSLAVMIFELVTGAPPFQAKTVAELAMKHVLEPAPPLPGVPPGLAQVIAQCMAKEPAERPSAAILGQALRAAIGAGAQTAAPLPSRRGKPVSSHDMPTMMSTTGGTGGIGGTGIQPKPGAKTERSGMSWGILALVVVTLGALGVLAALLMR